MSNVSFATAGAAVAVECSVCRWSGSFVDLDPIADFGERVVPGEPCPAGECPECEALAYLAPAEDQPRRKHVARDGASISTADGGGIQLSGPERAVVADTIAAALRVLSGLTTNLNLNHAELTMVRRVLEILR